MRLLLLLCGLFAAGVAASFPYNTTNTVDKAKTYCVCDTINIPAAGRTRTIYLVTGVTTGIDSSLEAWRNTGTLPAFRRIQGMRIASNDGTGTAGSLALVTIYKDGATSSMNRLFMWPYVWVEIPLEADSIVIRSVPAATQSFSYCIW